MEIINKPLPEIPADIAEKLKTAGGITLIEFEDKNKILKDDKLQSEAGYSRFSDGSYLVSMYCPMPGITADMIKWWFWWHPQADERYQVWFPGAHFGIGYDKKDSDYFRQPECPPFRENTQYPVEKIGGMKMPLRIDFLTAEHFGFSENVMEDCNVKLIVGGHVGAFKGLVWHTEMAHIYKEVDGGLYLISRFWLGRTMPPILRRLIINDKMAKSMAEHCAVEYRNLAEILPVLYAERQNHI